MWTFLPPSRLIVRSAASPPDRLRRLQFAQVSRVRVPVISLHRSVEQGDGRHRKAEGRAAILPQKAVAAPVDDPIEVAGEIRPLGVGDPGVIGQGRSLGFLGASDPLLDRERLAVGVVEAKSGKLLAHSSGRGKTRELIVRRSPSPGQMYPLPAGRATPGRDQRWSWWPTVCRKRGAVQVRLSLALTDRFHLAQPDLDRHQLILHQDQVGLCRRPSLRLPQDRFGESLLIIEESPPPCRDPPFRRR